MTGTGGRIFGNVQLRPIPDAELTGFERTFCGLDFGFAQDPDAFVRVAYERRSRTLYIFSEYVGAHDSAETLAREVAARAGREYVTCDSAEPRMTAELRRRGINALAAKKGPGSRECGYRFLQTLAAIVIDPARAPNAAREFCALEYPQDRTGAFLNEYPDGDDHTVDAVRYALEREMTRRTAYTGRTE